MDVKFNLLLVHMPGDQDIADWQAIAAMVESRAPDIEVGIADNTLRNVHLRRWQATRPSLVFAAGILRKFRPNGGRLYAGVIITKFDEVARFRAAGVPTPSTSPYERGRPFPASVWGEHVIVKPLRGLRGQGITLVPRADLGARWGELTDGGRTPAMVQRFIDTGTRPHHFRVATGLGIPLYMTRRWAAKAEEGQPRAPHDPQWRLVTNSSDHIEIMTDEAVLAFARKAAGAFPEVGILGLDIVREEATGKLFALEANSFGQTWHFSSDTHAKLRARTKLELDYYAQYGGLGALADELIKRVRTEAR